MRGILFSLFLLLFLNSCAGNPSMATELPTAVLFLTTTPSYTPTFIPPVLEITQPTPTIFTYTVVQGDTLIGIAGRYGISPEALISANPGVQASALPIGTKLIIPSGDAAAAVPIPTPVPLPVHQVRCWTDTDGGLWCFALVPNQYADTLENLSARFTLVDAGGKLLTSGTAYGLLDILPAGASMPLALHFPPPENNHASVQVQVLTAIHLLPGDTRYLAAVPGNTLVRVDSSGKTAEVSGQIILTGAGTANTTWVLATAFAADGNVVGVRRWESTSALTGGVPLSFDFQVYSVGPDINRVELLVEARP